MKKHVLTMLMTGTVAVALLVGCGNKTTGNITANITSKHEIETIKELI